MKHYTTQEALVSILARPEDRAQRAETEERRAAKEGVK
jgi:hypothetical protein